MNRKKIWEALNRPVFVVRVTPRQGRIILRLTLWVVLPLVFAVWLFFMWQSNYVEPLLKTLEHAEGMADFEVYP